MAAAAEPLKVMTIRAPASLFDRIAALVPKLEDDSTIGATGNVTLGLVTRVALTRGVELLEEKHGDRKPGRSRT